MSAPPFRLGISVPAYYGGSGGLEIVRLARLAEALGFDDLWMPDHVAFRKPIGDVQVMAAMAGAATERIQICTGVIQAAMRHPLALGKFLGALSHELPGRLVAGLGIGGDYRPEWQALGMDPARRGRLFDEVLAVLGPILRNEAVAHLGEFYRIEVDPLFGTPPPPIPIWIGARLEGAMHRAAAAEGWLGMLSRPDEFAAVRSRLVREARTAGRTAPKTGMLIVASVVGSDTAAKDRCAAFLRGIYGLAPGRGGRGAIGGLGTLRDMVAEYREAGADRVCITLVDPPDEAWPELARAFGVG